MTAETGLALKISSGQLALASGTDKPVCICAGPARSDGLVPVYRVHADMEFTTEAASDTAATTVGNAVTLSAVGDGVTATTTGGVFTLTYADGTKTVRGRFC